MINVGRIVNSRNFAQPGGFVVYRKTGRWKASRWVTTEDTLKMEGTITVATSTDIEQVPEGDRVKGAMCFYSQKPLFTTRAETDTEEGGTSDEIVWRNDRYRVVSVFPWGDFGFNKAIGVRMVGT
ncbi:hypothetical protein AB4114_11035 [Paenibacillus sp. 2RAB27]|uniref:hypothetical protein n=1 Tax=Paenibacillus sp. 2RAB27 TaxID=3232991 RepID=UPI003F990285